MNVENKAEKLFETIIDRTQTQKENLVNSLQGEMGVLYHLMFAENQITPSRLKEKLNVSMPRIISILKSLEAKQLILKEVDPKDKRKSIVSITELGKVEILRKKKIIMNQLIKVVSQLEEKDIDEYIRLMKKIGNIMKSTN